MRKNVLEYNALKQDASSKELNIGDSPSGKATDSDSVIREFKSLIPSQKRSNFCLPKVTSFFIHCESDGISSRFSVYIIAAGVYHQPQVVSLQQ